MKKLTLCVTMLVMMLIASTPVLAQGEAVGDEDVNILPPGTSKEEAEEGKEAVEPSPEVIEAREPARTGSFNATEKEEKKKLPKTGGMGYVLILVLSAGTLLVSDVLLVCKS